MDVLRHYGNRNLEQRGSGSVYRCGRLMGKDAQAQGFGYAAGIADCQQSDLELCCSDAPKRW